MDLKTANEITGGLQSTSKMPCKSFAIPARHCITGSKLRDVKGSICSKCYALKRRYSFSNVQNKMEERFSKINSPEWVEAMVTLIRLENNSEYFRWFSSGDLQSEEMLSNICLICKKTPNIKHWLVTREYSIVKEYKKKHKIPSNLTIRLSAHMINQKLKTNNFNSMVVDKDKIDKLPKSVYVCPSKDQHGKCGDCRVCWGKKKKTVAYIKH